jgi:hypothetical protein
MPSANVMVETVMLAALVLPAFIIWRIPWKPVSVPVAVLLAGGLMFVAGAIPLTAFPDYDGIGAAMTMGLAPIFGCAYTLFLAAIDRARRRSAAERSDSRHAAVGLVIWAGLGTLCVAVPLIVPLDIRKGDTSFLTEYIFFCGPIFLLALTMSLAYLRWLLRPPWEPAGLDAGGSGPPSRTGPGYHDLSSLAVASIVLGVFSFGFGPLTGFPGLLAGLWARSRVVSPDDGSDRRAAEVGMVVSVVAMVLWVLCLAPLYLAGKI